MSVMSARGDGPARGRGLDAAGIGRWLLILLIPLPALLLWPFRHAAFVSDDRWFATGPLVDRYADLLTTPWPHPFGAAQAYRPLVLLSYLLTRSFTDNTPFVYHLSNFLLHGVNAALLAGLLTRVSGSVRAGLMAGVIFAVHPITHENVMWISGRTYPLAAAFALALLWWTAAALIPDRVETVAPTAAPTPVPAAVDTAVSVAAPPAEDVAPVPRWRAGSFAAHHTIGALLLVGALISYELAIALPVMVAGLTLWLGTRRVGPGLWSGAGVRAAARHERGPNRASGGESGPEAGGSEPRVGPRMGLRPLLASIGVYASVTLLYLIFRWIFISSAGSDAFVATHGTAQAWIATRAPRRLLANAWTVVRRLIDGNAMMFPEPIDRFGTVLAIVLLIGGCVALFRFRTRVLALAQGASRAASAPPATDTAAATAASPVAAPAQPTALQIAIAALVMGALAYAPVGMATNYNDRLTYLTAAAFAAFVAIGWDAWYRASRGLLRAVSIILLGSVLIWWSLQLRTRGAEWQHAGAIAESLLTQLRALEPTPAPNVSLHIAGVPLVHRSAYIFITYFHHAVRHHYGREDLDVVVNDDPPGDRLLQQVQARLASRRAVDPATPPSHLFWWDQRTERLIRLLPP